MFTDNFCGLFVQHIRIISQRDTFIIWIDTSTKLEEILEVELKLPSIAIQSMDFVLVFIFILFFVFTE